MNKTFTSKSTIAINAPASKVWDVLIIATDGGWHYPLPEQAGTKTQRGTKLAR